MNKININARFLTITGMIIAGAVLRLVPHYPNFTPIAAIALFGGAYFTNKKLAVIVPFSAMLLSDLVLGYHSTFLAVYISFALIVAIGFTLRKKRSVLNIAAASISSSILFFIITNFAFWYTGAMYPMNATGLAECYTAAIPFFNSTLLGDLFYTGVFFGAFEFAKYKLPVLEKVKA
ncbi:MAG: hypothetical protein P4L45_04720 [Ignavibacteriaceae bacterium]|nr:hypothetical protein [Ignavibacteriaceae bacterium]